ncbi:MAG: hypothetical protein H6662_20475 [Ardenticatenaceae bacterium]|nr:hypothetical protein [Anaerolineales bacterium]MCB8923963.1 hypothetical protein [Ardenticatenaceae bacterium]MCB9005533.1 hypothetical protein [Ardenticatenaceae bacterium]
MSSTNFTGLSMPVFTAFGWAGEETAQKFAFEQLDLFISQLHARLSHTVQAELAYYGLSRENQGAYLAANSEVERDAHIAFYARPMSLEVQLAITAKEVLSKGFSAAEKDVLGAHRLVTELGPEWSLRVQQLLVEEESGAISHYQDLFKDSVSQFSPELAQEVFSKAAYLVGQEKWLVSFYLSRRLNSEQVAAMGLTVLQVLNDLVETLMPVLSFFTGRVGRKKGTRRAAARKVAVTQQAVAVETAVAPEDTFTFVSELKPLHIRRGFINMTPKEWPFFALNARTETRKVTVYYEGLYDKKSTVWRLQPGDMARLVLGPASHEWLEDAFVPNDRIELQVTRLEGNEIQVTLRPVTD